MAVSASQPPSPLFLGCGSPVSPESDLGELASEPAITSIDAQSTVMDVVHARDTPELQSLETPHGFSQPILSDMVNSRAVSAEVNHGSASPLHSARVPTPQLSREGTLQTLTVDTPLSLLRWGWDGLSLDRLPNEVLMQILGCLDVSDLLTTSRVSQPMCYRIPELQLESPSLI